MLYLLIYRKNTGPTQCVLCGKHKVLSLLDEPTTEVCVCLSSTDCEACKTDLEMRLAGRLPVHYRYSCELHGEVGDTVVTEVLWQIVITHIKILLPDLRCCLSFRQLWFSTIRKRYRREKNSLFSFGLNY